MAGFISHVLVGGADDAYCVNCGISLSEIQRIRELCPNCTVVCHPRPNLLKVLLGGAKARKGARVVFTLI
jgi:hypothetical protein